jgi:hypothetical protein
MVSQREIENKIKEYSEYQWSVVAKEEMRDFIGLFIKKMILYTDKEVVSDVARRRVVGCHVKAAFAQMYKEVEEDG